MYAHLFAVADVIFEAGFNLALHSPQCAAGPDVNAPENSDVNRKETILLMQIVFFFFLRAVGRFIGQQSEINRPQLYLELLS